ncbi:hypothetical protein M8J77_012911 [Diaphorina citri]|nr:hypothetical protein M8J77_012911 [Diaphorina citri]
MFVLHTFLLTVCLVVSRVCAGYEVINNEIVERIDLDNSQDLQHLATSSVKTTPKINHHVEEKPREDLNSVQASQDSLGVTNHQPSIVYAAIQAMPHIMTRDDKSEETDKAKVKSVTILQEEKPQDIKKEEYIKKPNNKFDDPSEDKSKDVKAKLYAHLKQSLPKLYSLLNVEITKSSGEQPNASSGEEATLRHIDVQPYATIIDDEKDLKAEQSEPYVVYDKQDYVKPKHVRKTVKTHKIGDDKKNFYPKQDTVTPTKGKDDMETDNTIWIGYGLGVPVYKYPYNYPSSLYGSYYTYGRPYSGWSRGYTGPYYYGDRTGLGYTGSYNNYGTGYGPYGGYL